MMYCQKKARFYIQVCNIVNFHDLFKYLNIIETSFEKQNKKADDISDSKICYFVKFSSVNKKVSAI